MNHQPLFLLSEHPEFSSITQAVSSGRYFRRLGPEILVNILKQGALLTLKKDSFLIREGDKVTSEMYILVEGSLAVISKEKFILRLDQSGDVVGEMGVIQSAPRSADVIAETECRLIAFPSHLFEVEPRSSHASVLYVMFAHILVEKLRITTAQSMIQKNQRSSVAGAIKIGIADTNPADRAMIKSAIGIAWPEAKIIEFDELLHFINEFHSERFNLIIADTDSFGEKENDWCLRREWIRAMHFHSAHIVVLSKSCHNPATRKLLIKLGVDDVLSKPCAEFDIQHIIEKVQTWHYKDIELDRAENEAETDRLTGLANRRRLDQFLDALLTVYPEEKKPFSVIMTDVDNFKHYNDANGHQMGDVVLRNAASLMVREVRRGDLAARYGGEEFMVILPDCEKEVALELAERLRTVVELAPFPQQDKQPGGNLTMTLGVASFPDDAAELDALLKKADDCLYEGKRRGKNIVISAKTDMPYCPIK